MSIEEAFRAGYAAGRRVKPLVWNNDDGIYTSQGYIITKGFSDVVLYGAGEMGGFKKSIKAAKAAAQLHHDAHILAQLE